MPCYHPLKAWQQAPGVKPVFAFKAGYQELTLPCGRCIGCRLERSRQWAVRVMHEDSMHDQSYFLTLTFDKDHYPDLSKPIYPYFQGFMKRYRARFPDLEIRFYMCFEYGENFGRPHFHACIFGHLPDDAVLYKRTFSGDNLYTSSLLESLWPYGFCPFGDVTFASAAYIARYCTKKITGDAADEHYTLTDPDTGEIIRRPSEFNRMSLKPGIGARWIDRYHTDVYPSDEVIVRGRPVKPPRYYDKRFGDRIDPEFFLEVKEKRLLDMQKNLDDNTPERLAVKEKIAVARHRDYHRCFENG